jgi:hypothetical protein
MEEKIKNKEKTQLEEQEKYGPEASSTKHVKILIERILPFIIIVIMFGSIIWMTHILCNGGPKGALEIIVTIIGCLSCITVIATSF